MGVWSSAAKFLSKQAERAMLVFSGVQWGDSSNDSDKTIAAVTAYQNLRAANEKLEAHEQHSTLLYIVSLLVIVIVIFMVVLCMKMLLDNVRTNARTNQNQRSNTISLNTLRSTNSAPAQSV